MYARIGTWRGHEAELDRWVERSRSEVAPQVVAQPGCRGVLFLRDLDGGRGLTLTLWQDEAALRASDAFATSMQAGTTTASGARVKTTRYEVVEAVLPA